MLGTSADEWVLADYRVDQFLKGHEGNRLKGKYQKLVKQLKQDGKVRLAFNNGFFSKGDSKLPENAGILASAVGPVLVLLDLGLAREFTPEKRKSAARLAAAVVSDDPARAASAFRELGLEARAQDDEGFATIAELIVGHALASGRAYADPAMVERINDELWHALRDNPIVKAGSDLLLVLRVMGLLSGLGKQLDSQVDPVKAMVPFLVGLE